MLLHLCVVTAHQNKCPAYQYTRFSAVKAAQESGVKQKEMLGENLPFEAHNTCSATAQRKLKCRNKHVIKIAECGEGHQAQIPGIAEKATWRYGRSYTSPPSQATSPSPAPRCFLSGGRADRHTGGGGDRGAVLLVTEATVWVQHAWLAQPGGLEHISFIVCGRGHSLSNLSCICSFDCE